MGQYERVLYIALGTIIGLGVVCFVVSLVKPSWLDRALDGLHCLSVSVPAADIAGDIDTATGIDNAEIIFDIHREPLIGDATILPNYVNDVHSHQIQQSIRNSIERLKGWCSASADRSSTDSMREIKQYIFSCDATPENKEKAYNVFRAMEKIDERLHSVQLTETEILKMVWRRICDPANISVVAQLKSSLFESLADSAITLDMPYCLTGRISRIVQSLQCLDHDGIVDITSIDIIRREIQNKVPAILNDYFTDNPEQRALFDSGAPLSDRLRTYITSRLADRYPKDREVSEVITEQIKALEV